MKIILATLTVLVLGIGIWLYKTPDYILNLVYKIEYFGSSFTREEIAIAGETFVYLEGGDSNKAPILFIHGFGSDKNHWVRFTAQLNKQFRFVVPDLGGFGESLKDRQKTYDTEYQVERLKAFVSQLDLKPFHIVGTSMGGLIATVFSAKYPEQVKSLAVLTSSGIKTNQLSDVRKFRKKTGQNPLLLSNEQDFDRMMSYVFVEVPSIPGVLKRHFVEESIANRDFNAKIYLDFTSHMPDYENLFTTIRSPSLILWCDQDRVIHVSKAYKLAKLIPSSKLEVLKGCGHALAVERPNEIAQRYIEFISSH